MSHIFLNEGLVIEFCDSQPFKRGIIKRESKGRIILACIYTAEACEFDQSALLDRIGNGTAKLLSDRRHFGQVTFADLPVEDQIEATRRYKYIREIVNKNITKITQKNVGLILEEKAKEIGETPPHWQTLRNWYNAYAGAGFKMRGLYPKHRMKGRRESRYESIVDEVIINESKRYFKNSKPSVASIHRNVEAKIIELKLENPSLDIPIPTYQSVKDRLQRYSYEKTKSQRDGRKKFENDLTETSSDIVTTRVLERVEIDHTQLDIHLLHDELGTLLGRPYITVLIDHHSHMVLGLQLSFENPSFGSVCIACANAFLKKDEYLSGLNEDRSWPAHGIPELLVTDNGNEFWGEDFASVADEIGSVFQYCPIRTPHYKGRVERFFGIVNTEVLDDLPGVVRKPGECAEGYDAAQDAKMTFTELKKHLIKWIVGVYHNRPIEEQNQRTPNEIWSDSEEDVPIVEESEEELFPILMGTKTKKLRKGGIRLFNLFYNSSLLKDILRRDGPKDVQIKYNPFDLGYIYMFDEKNKLYLKVLCTDFHYASGMSKYEHNKTREHARRLRKNKLQNEDLLKAKVELANQRDEAHARNARRKKQVTTAKAARIEQIGVEPLKLVVDNENSVIDTDFENDELDFDGWSAD